MLWVPVGLAVGQERVLVPLVSGSGLRGGGEKLAHTVRATAEARPTDCWVALDLSDAFGTMLRDGALEAAAAVVPDCRAFLAMFLQRDTRYRFVQSSGKDKVSVSPSEEDEESSDS